WRHFDVRVVFLDVREVRHYLAILLPTEFRDVWREELLDLVCKPSSVAEGDARILRRQFACRLGEPTVGNNHALVASVVQHRAEQLLDRAIPDIVLPPFRLNDEVSPGGSPTEEIATLVIRRRQRDVCVAHP